MKYTKYIFGIFLFGIVGVGVGLVAREATKEDGVTKPVTDESQTQLTTQAVKTAKYKVTFEATWSEDTHLSTFPPDAHTSPAIVATHSTEGSLFMSGELASPGVQEVAETGATDLIEPELVANSDIHAYIKGARIDVPGDNSVEIEATQDADLLSFISMLAPSPDWFVGLDSIELYDGDGSGEWLEVVVLPVLAYDAGTDSGITFTSSNQPTLPQTPISLPADSGFIEAAATQFGTITIELISE